jgi:hypothetical protein
MLVVSFVWPPSWHQGGTSSMKEKQNMYCLEMTVRVCVHALNHVSKSVFWWFPSSLCVSVFFGLTSSMLSYFTKRTKRTHTSSFNYTFISIVTKRRFHTTVYTRTMEISGVMCLSLIYTLNARGITAPSSSFALSARWLMKLL